MAINKLALNALTAPEPSAYQQWLLDIAAELMPMYHGRVTREVVLTYLVVTAAQGGLPAEVTPSPRGVGVVVNSILDIVHYKEGKDA